MNRVFGLFIYTIFCFFSSSPFASELPGMSAKCGSYNIEFKYLLSTPSLRISTEEKTRLGIGQLEERGFSFLFPGEPPAMLTVDRKNKVRFAIMDDTKEPTLVVCTNILIRDK